MWALFIFVLPGLASSPLLFHLAPLPRSNRIVWAFLGLFFPLLAWPLYIYTKSKNGWQFLGLFVGGIIAFLVYVCVFYPLTPSYKQQLAENAEQDRLRKIEEASKAKEEKVLQEKKEAKQRIKREIEEEAAFSYTEKAADEFVSQFQKNGLIDSLELETRKVYVSPVLWASIKAKEKKQFSILISNYFGRKSGVHYPSSVHIIDAYSDKELASYDILWGFKAKD